jgi:hypothetical protein
MQLNEIFIVIGEGKVNNKLRLLMINTLIISMTGCATIVSGDSQIINVQAYSSCS